MGSRTFNFLFRMLLTASLLASLFISSQTQPAAASRPQDSAAAAARHGAAAAPAVPAAGLAPQAVVTIPALPVGIAPTVDGSCDPAEYQNQAGNPFVDSGGTSALVYLIHDNTWLYVCMVGAFGTNASRFGSLYLDPNGNGSSYTYAQQDDFGLHVPIPGQLGSGSSFKGTGAGNYTAAGAVVNGYWDGASQVITDKVDMVEYRLNLKDFNLTTPCGIFNLAMYHHWVDLPNGASDFGWPSNQWYDQPGTWQPVTLGGGSCGAAGKVAYVYRSNDAAASNFYNLLTTNGYSVTLVPLSSVMTTNFMAFDLILIADDTGSLDQWGTPGLTASQVNQIANNPTPTLPGRPIIGLGEGGYAFFGRLSLFIGWPQGWHGPQDKIIQPGAPPFTGLFNGVSAVANPVTHYSAPINSVGIYLPPLVPLPLDVTAFGMENPLDDHSSLILQGCRMLWGNSGDPFAMTGDGKIIFINTVAYMWGFRSQCPTPPPPPSTNCLNLTKDATSPADPGPLPIGTPITYNLHYTLTGNPGCPTTAKLVDHVPFGTTFAGSADGVTLPGPDGTLTWYISGAGSGTKSFKVIVGEAPCTTSANPQVSNFAELRPGPTSSGTVLSPKVSNTVTYNILCPPVGLPNQGPVFAEDELQIDPYPLTAGTTSLVSVRVTNLTASSQPVTVQFQASPAGLGIGLAYLTFGTASAALPAHGTGVLTAHYVASLGGNQCIQVLVATPSMASPLITQRCLDVTEDLSAGITDHLPVPVRNNTAGSTAISLVVDNTCPGWTAVVTPATTNVLAPGASQTVDFSVTPPAPPAILGTGCHIDLQGWVGTTLIGGIRKLDLPPVHLPENVQPPWEEPEVIFRPDPPVAGSAGQICVQLANPLGYTKTVTVQFSVADFGAGIGFTPIPGGSHTFDLLPHSLSTYCLPWTPDTGGTLHRCALVTLSQEGFQDEHSQHNVDVRAPATGDLSTFVIPFIAGNPDLLTDHIATFNPVLVGINPMWGVIVEMGDGSVLPSSLVIPGGGQVSLQLRFVLAAAVASTLAPTPQLAPLDFYFGSQSSVEVTLLLDGLPSGGFSLRLVPNRAYMPVIKK